MRYKGTIDQKMLLNSHSLEKTLLKQCMGRLLPCDIGKRYYEVNGVYQVESSEQFTKRMRDSNGNS